MTLFNELRQLWLVVLQATKLEGVGIIAPAPKGKKIWGSVTISDRGQIVIPKAAREKFGLMGGQRLIVCSDEVGIALVPAAYFEEQMKAFMDFASSCDEA